MSDLKTKLFSKKKTWISGTYETTEEAFLVAEYFARYVKKRWPAEARSSGLNQRGYLYLEQIDVIFCSMDKVPRKTLKLGYSSSVLQVLIPNRGYSEEQKERLRDFYQQKYTPILKESHARTNAFLWQTFSESERSEILKTFDVNTQEELNIKKDILRELAKIVSRDEFEIIKMQTRPQSAKKNSDENI